MENPYTSKAFSKHLNDVSNVESTAASSSSKLSSSAILFNSHVNTA